jgi:hypothetical protein
MLEREFDKAGTWATPATVQAELCELFIRCHKTTVHAPEYLSCMDAVAAALCLAVRPAAPLTLAPIVASDTAADILRARALGGDQEATRLLALMSNQGKGKGKGKGKEGKNKNVAGVTRIVGGKLCASGTCHFDHDVKFPGQKCYRDPRWNGPLPPDYADRPTTVARINDDRTVNAKRLGVSHTPLQVPAKSGVKPLHPLLGAPIFGMFGMPEESEIPAAPFRGQGCEPEDTEQVGFSGQDCEDDDDDVAPPMAPLLPGASIPPSRDKLTERDVLASRWTRWSRLYNRRSRPQTGPRLRPPLAGFCLVMHRRSR